jgi:hypothetical protein
MAEESKPKTHSKTKKEVASEEVVEA